MIFRSVNLPQRLRFALAALAMLVALWGATDVHSHQSGLHTPTVCSICALENAVSGGCAPAHVWIPETAQAGTATASQGPRLIALVRPAHTPIRAPPFA